MAFKGNNACEAWINAKGNNTVSIRDSYNFSSMNDNGTGDYTFSFTDNMSNTNYCAVGSCTYLIGQVARFRTLSPYVWHTNNIRIVSGYNDTSADDHETVTLVVFGDN